MVWDIPLWQKIVLYSFILIALYIYVKVSNIKIAGIPLVPLRYRILLALFFPVIIILGIFLSSFVIAIVLTLILIALLSNLLRKVYK